MDLLRRLMDLFLHLDVHLSQVIAQYGTWTHLILFAIVFCETGLVVTPFLPGDSLLFAAGTFAALAAVPIREAIALAMVRRLPECPVRWRWIPGSAFPSPSHDGKQNIRRAERSPGVHGGVVVDLDDRKPEEPVPAQA